MRYDLPAPRTYKAHKSYWRVGSLTQMHPFTSLSHYTRSRTVCSQLAALRPRGTYCTYIHGHALSSPIGFLHSTHPRRRQLVDGSRGALFDTLPRAGPSLARDDAPDAAWCNRRARGGGALLDADDSLVALLAAPLAPLLP